MIERQTRLILDEKYAISSKYRLVLQVIQVPKSGRFPSGIKARFVMINMETGSPRFLMDNHEPYGFHMHPDLPADPGVRVDITAKDYNAALALFFEEVERIISDEEN